MCQAVLGQRSDKEMPPPRALKANTHPLAQRDKQQAKRFGEHKPAGPHLIPRVFTLEKYRRTLQGHAVSPREAGESNRPKTSSLCRTIWRAPTTHPAPKRSILPHILRCASQKPRDEEQTEQGSRIHEQVIGVVHFINKHAHRHHDLGQTGAANIFP